ncbi:MAG: hypothetical protein JO271_15930 [Verrucomicrobia bacterium]|nr:hypothetical protein [Verrucomicrobiota bacterium]MBV9272823.1 hypothetical protein [Verrucomicrobiota bacterium]
MTHLKIIEQATDEFSITGQNGNTGADDSGIIFYDDVTKVHVMPDRESFTIQVLTPDVAVEMDFPDADRVRDALGLFETKKVSEVSPEVPNSVRITPLESEEQAIQK